jgi:hypothetical protein
MDTAFYTAGAVHLAQTRTLTSPFIWNYLTNPAAIPHPGFLYWMPLPSMLAAPFAALFPGSFFALQLPFVLLSSLIPVVTYHLALRVTERRALAWTAGLLTIFSGFFFPYWTLPETFAPFALFGSLALWLGGKRMSTDGAAKITVLRWSLVGSLVGLAHLTRADGILLLPVVALAPLAAQLLRHPRHTSEETSRASGTRRTSTRWARAFVPLLALGVGYLVMMAPWFVRNSLAIGTPLSPAGTKTIWLTDYDDLFCYTCDLTPASYLSWGWSNILSSKLSALWINTQRFVAEDCLVFLLPFTIIGLYRLRRRLSFLLASVYLVGIYLAHSLVFTFPGWRGGFFHASSAALPFLFAASMEGLSAAVRWAAKRRPSWRYRQALSVFAAATAGAALILSGFLAAGKIAEWRRPARLYADVDSWLGEQGAAAAGVMVGNPPAFWYHTRRPTAVIPNEDVQTLLQAADRYGMRYVLLEQDHPAPMAGLHRGEAEHPRLRSAREWSDLNAILYAIQPVVE